MNRDGLKKIYLINSADFQFAQIDLSDNTLLLGESGVGKTTIMRAILFFYTMNHDSTILNINTETKKSFTQWYFQHANSYIVYEYIKNGVKFLFIVSSRGKIHYTFIDVANSGLGVIDLLLSDNTPVTLEQLNENLQKHSLQYYQTTRKENYINAFHRFSQKGSKIRHKSDRDFSLFENRVAREEFSKTLSNIFATSKVSSDSIKRTIVSLVDESSTNINLKEIKDSLSEYVDERDEITKFEKQIPSIKNLSQSMDEYKEKKRIFKNSANEIDVIKRHSRVKLLELEDKYEEIEKSQLELNREYNPKIEKSKKILSKQSAKNSVDKSDISRLKIKQQDYKSKNIDALVKEFEQKRYYSDSLTQYQNRYDALTSDAKDIENRYSKIFHNYIVVGILIFWI
jgi:ABC-type cobalamin/Fe3+-siderophores transport system ATPase subunit